LSTCTLNPLQLTDAFTMHRYAAHKQNLGADVKLGALAHNDIPEAYSIGADKIGVQFHPEMKYFDQSDPSTINRHKQFFDNIFGIFEGYYRSMQYAKKMGI